MGKTTRIQSYQNITFNDIADAVEEVLDYRYTSFAPLGSSSKTLILCGVDGNERRSGISMRLHSGMISMLICDSSGNFLYHGKFDSRLNKNMISASFQRAFDSVREFIGIELK